ncbi:CvpA family protein [Fulvivirga lutimaris]|uniref:CvpA family protein n=1 Tax=Fulvivirga lutimaris TaxID=1819566 RepID=UPI0012BCFC1F|nr:CvpA family protein [Fulvivirga lutimaris]MTI41293.1 CvpA family protein [Fulvivirga lutimaris]
MNTLDIIILAPLLFGAYRGFKKGFVLEIVAIVSFVLAIIGGFKLMHWGMDLIDQYFDISGELLPYISFIVIFIGIILLTNLVGKVFKKILDLTLLGTVDNLAGAVLSVIKWAFGISVLLWLSTSFGINFSEEWVEGSVLYEPIVTFAPKLVEYLSAVVPYTNDLFDHIQKLLSGSTSS